ncbi:hypothetical protein A7J67_18345 [Achromobacter xylosoxidans]|nr:hypothetical protein A7J67_18345 [Achromobacter xylosoxidans]
MMAATQLEVANMQTGRAKAIASLRVLGIFLLGVALTFWSAMYLESRFKTDPNVAGWVQGIGSILAILGAVWAAMAQSRSSLEAVRVNLLLTEKRQQRAILAVAEASVARVDSVVAAVEIEQDWRSSLDKVYVRPILDGLVAALSAVPAHSLPTRDAVTAFLMLQQHLVFFANNVDELIAGPWKHGHLGPLLMELRAAFDRSQNPSDQKEMYARVNQANEAFKTNVRTQAVQIHRCFDQLRSEVTTAQLDQ